MTQLPRRRQLTLSIHLDRRRRELAYYSIGYIVMCIDGSRLLDFVCLYDFGSATSVSKLSRRQLYSATSIIFSGVNVYSTYT